MSRAQRLLDLIQVLRRHRRAAPGAVLARELGVSLRTLYRDIGALKAQGAHIDGEAGVGYILRPGFMLPPLMFSEEEIEALVLGSRWVSERADGPLGQAARNVLAKIGAVLPADLKDGVEGSGLLIGPGGPPERVPKSGNRFSEQNARQHRTLPAGDSELPAIRQAIRAERKIRIVYADEQGNSTRRTVWPVALAFYDRARVVVAWCELRDGYRHFRTDRITALEPTAERYARRRAALFREWRALRGVPEQ